MSSYNKIIPNTKRRYSITICGKVWSFPKRQGKDNYLSKGRYLKQQLLPNGYCRVTLSVKGKAKSHLVHRLVARTFLRNDENKRTVNHIDGNKQNNNLSNLEWATYSENHKHAFKNGLMKISNKCKDIAKENIKKAIIKNRKLSVDDASEICEAYATGIFTQEELAIPFGVNRKTISNLVRGVSYGI